MAGYIQRGRENETLRRSLQTAQDSLGEISNELADARQNKRLQYRPSVRSKASNAHGRYLKNNFGCSLSSSERDQEGRFSFISLMEMPKLKALPSSS